MQHPGLGGHDRRAAVTGVLGRVGEHPARGEHVHALGVDVAGGHVLHDRGRAAALGMDEEVGARMLGARARDVGGTDAGVDVALAIPHVERSPDHLLDVGAEEHVGPEEDLGVGAVLAQDVLDDLDRVRRGHAVVGQRLDLGRRVDVHDGDRAGVLGLPGAQLLGGDRVGQRAAGVEVGNQDGLLGREDRGRLGHEVHAAEGDRRGVGRGALVREAERIADVVGDVLHLGELVVVGEDDRVALGARARGPRPAGRGRPRARGRAGDQAGPWGGSRHGLQEK